MILDLCIDTFFNTFYRNIRKFDVKGTILKAVDLQENMYLSEIKYINMYLFKNCKIESITEINLSGSGDREHANFMITFSWSSVEYIPDKGRNFKDMENPKEIIVSNFNKDSYIFTV
jgi:hypothetical protein